MRRLYIFLILLGFGNLSANADSYNIFIPDEVLTSFDQLSSGQKRKYCKARGNFVFEQLLEATRNPPKRIKGFNSAMSNTGKVEGAGQTTSFTTRMSEAVTDALVTSKSDNKEIALNALSSWAESNALVDTPNCFDDNNCGSYWAKGDPNGNKPYKGHDFTTAQLALNHLAYGYFFSLAAFKPDDVRHEKIKNWLTRGLKRSAWKKTSDYYPRQDSSFTWNILMLQEIEGKVDKRIIGNLIKASEKVLNDDGSIEKATTRGVKAIWYHNITLNEIMINMEIARKYGVEIPSALEKKVEKAANLFVTGWSDHSYMDKWARVAYNRPFKAGKQDIQSDISKILSGTSWWNIFQYRYPKSDTSKKLADLLKGKKNQSLDASVGIGLGCVYKTLLN